MIKIVIILAKKSNNIDFFRRKNSDQGKKVFFSKSNGVVEGKKHHDISGVQYENRGVKLYEIGTNGLDFQIKPNGLQNINSQQNLNNNNNIDNFEKNENLTQNLNTNNQVPAIVPSSPKNCSNLDPRRDISNSTPQKIEKNWNFEAKNSIEKNVQNNQNKNFQKLFSSPFSIPILTAPTTVNS